MVEPSGPLPPSISAYLASAASTLNQGYVFSGPLAVSDDVVSELGSAQTQPPPSSSLTILTTSLPTATVGSSYSATLSLGSLLAVMVAVGLSPLTPLGPVRPVYPNPGIAFDWTVLGLGLLTLIVLLSALAFVLAFRGAPHLQARRRQLREERGSAVARAAAGAGMRPRGGRDSLRP